MSTNQSVAPLNSNDRDRNWTGVLLQRDDVNAHQRHGDDNEHGTMRKQCSATKIHAETQQLVGKQQTEVYLGIAQYGYNKPHY